MDSVTFPARHGAAVGQIITVEPQGKIGRIVAIDSPTSITVEFFTGWKARWWKFWCWLSRAPSNAWSWVRFKLGLYW